ncbi:hypothetical protein M409DRAFT_64543 [Zasmidium cellare ATCC 36951]|uniref:Glycoside hydrolase family 30 protein n=1 Tax=Zasmidium cellare ATCC 36951 TaxID=1080233 RepID=A0A6A6CVI1_ZASCE|nr:uncharacterized protein M409DRAFT_64543 [Zasmidium cellare ATCC 36951]KAF2170210.1 hypothetical protein M409DRAFT_64543 [Zasmidium cellare ATCC 36951]
MKSGRVLALCIAFLISHVAGQESTPIGGLSGSHTDIPRWCGKPYEAGSPNFNPGGQIEPPAPSPSLLLDLKVTPRHSIYDSSESKADFIVSATLSHTHGDPISGNEGHWWWGGRPSHSGDLDITIEVEGNRSPLVSGRLAMNSTAKLFDFDLTKLEPRLEPYPIVLVARPAQGRGKRSYNAETELYYLPAKSSGSTVKIDNLHGGMLVANNVSNYAFEPIVPFGFYTSCSGYLNYSLANVTAYKDMGFNAINPVCAFTDGDLGYLFDWMDSVDLWYQYDMRGSYLNLTSVAEQIPLVKDRSNLLSWYTADEPDGWQYNLSSTRRAYDLLKKEDPYHPTGLVLNCQDYYFEDYTSGTDYIMEDAYPVGIDPNYSRRFNTTVNETYGDCGCDNCIGSLADVSDRLDDFFEYQQWLGDWQKPLWAVLQAFSGEDYWARSPTNEESWVMMIISFNHKAKAMMSWTFPTTPLSLAEAHSAMAKVVTATPVSDFLFEGDPTSVEIQGKPQVDVSYWTSEGKFMVALANIDQKSSNGSVSIRLPAKANKILSQPWGSLSWYIDNAGRLCTSGLDGLATSIVVVES